MAKISLEEVPSNSIERPLLVDILPEDLPDNLTLRLHQNENPRKSKQLVIRGENDYIKFEAANFGPVPSIASAFSYALLYTDEGSGSLHLLGPCERLGGKRSVRALEGAVDRSKEQIPEQVDYKTAQNALGEAFGTKKRKQAIHSLEKNQIDIARLQASSAGFINKTIDDAIISRLPTPDPSETASSHDVYIDNGILPPHCISAEKPLDCYPLCKLIPQDIWMGLQLFKDESSFLSSLNPGPYIRCRVQRLIETDNSSNGRFIAAYLHYLLKLCGLKESQFNDHRITGAALAGLDIVIQARVLSEFSEKVVTDNGKTRYKLPSAKKDRLILHICVLALHLNSSPLRVCVNELAGELGLSVTKMSQYFRSLGCTVETQRTSKGGDGRNTQLRFALLSTRLVFPKPSFRR